MGNGEWGIWGEDINVFKKVKMEGVGVCWGEQNLNKKADEQTSVCFGNELVYSSFSL